MQLSIRWTAAALGMAALLGGAARAEDALVVTAVPSGPSPAAIRAVEASLPSIPALRDQIAGHRWRLVSLRIMPAGKSFQANVYDYTRSQLFVVEGTIATPRTATVRASADLVDPSNEEFDEAVRTLQAKPEWKKRFAATSFTFFRPMPPLDEEAESGRVVNVGVHPAKGGPTQIVGVNLSTGGVVTYSSGAPTTSLAATTAASCGPTASGQADTNYGTPGQADITISRSGVTLWQFTVIRPAASSGTRASGIEFLNIRYKGKTVLAHLHTPILNVHYVGDLCGPYRDWMWSEDPFQASGTLVAPGVMNASTMPTTIFDTGNDTGTFAGVAYYIGSNNVTFKSELQAGWYRYSPIYTFDDTGALHMRRGFSAVNNSCTCNIHLHNAYFRMVFDVDGNANSVISRRNQGGWSVVPTETWGRRDRLGSTAFQVRNAVSGDTYQVNSSAYDYTADAYGIGDWWVLKSHDPSEIDDGETCSSCSTTYIHINGFVNGESVENTQLVLWYGGHFLHNVNDNYPTSGGEVVGPDIVPVSW